MILIYDDNLVKIDKIYIFDAAQSFSSVYFNQNKFNHTIRGFFSVIIMRRFQRRLDMSYTSIE